LPRAFALHAGAILSMLALGALHLWRLRKDGGLAAASEEPDEKLPAAPWLYRAEGAVALLTLAILLALSLFVDAPIYERADPWHPPNPARAPWYFVGVQERVSHYLSRWVVAPTLIAPSAAGTDARPQPHPGGPLVCPGAALAQPALSRRAIEPDRLHHRRAMVPYEQLAVAPSFLKVLNKGDSPMRNFGRIFILFLTVACLFTPWDAGMESSRRSLAVRRLKMADSGGRRPAGEECPTRTGGAFSFVFTSESVEVGYKIAVKESELLGNPDIAVKEQSIPCYCFCDAMGHKSLLHCFWKEGKAGGEFDDHAAGCNICYGQAMFAFLWKNLGASDQEILKGMEKKFGHLPKPPPH
jgi:hypothetical protein